MGGGGSHEGRMVDMVKVSSVYSFRSPKGLRPKYKSRPPVPVVLDIAYSFILPER